MIFWLLLFCLLFGIEKVDRKISNTSRRGEMATNVLDRGCLKITVDESFPAERINADSALLQALMETMEILIKWNGGKTSGLKETWLTDSSLCVQTAIALRGIIDRKKAINLSARDEAIRKVAAEPVLLIEEMKYLLKETLAALRDYKERSGMTALSYFQNLKPRASAGVHCKNH